MQKQKALVQLKLLRCKKATMDVLPLTFEQERKKVLKPGYAFVNGGLMTIKHCNTVRV